MSTARRQISISACTFAKWARGWLSCQHGSVRYLTSSALEQPFCFRPAPDVARQRCRGSRWHVIHRYLSPRPCAQAARAGARLAKPIIHGSLCLSKHLACCLQDFPALASKRHSLTCSTAVPVITIPATAWRAAPRSSAVYSAPCLSFDRRRLARRTATRSRAASNR